MFNYKDSGVDIEAGYEAVRLMRQFVKTTYRPEVLTDIGGFGGLFSLGLSKYRDPVLVSGTDGVGTKLKIAFLMNRHDTIGIDCVAMCVNDIVCSGAEPLFFLDYLAVGRNKPEKVAEIVKGVASGCVMAGCALIGGETAEMPGFYAEGEYDIAGFAVGIVEKDMIIDGSLIKEGDKLIGISSSGLHSNGYSLVRKILKPSEEKLSGHIQSLGCTLGEELLRPTKIYTALVADLKKQFVLKGIANITGGGFIENIPRMFPSGLKALIYRGSWPVQPIFGIIRDAGDINEKEMFNTFNMGIGMVMAVGNDQADSVIQRVRELKEDAFVIGEVVSGEAGVELC